MSEANEGLMAIAANSIASKDFLGYHANGQNGLEGAAPRRLKHPASRYLEIKHLRKFRECFFDCGEL